MPHMRLYEMAMSYRFVPPSGFGYVRFRHRRRLRTEPLPQVRAGMLTCLRWLWPFGRLKLTENHEIERYREDLLKAVKAQFPARFSTRERMIS